MEVWLLNDRPAPALEGKLIALLRDGSGMVLQSFLLAADPAASPEMYQAHESEILAWVSRGGVLFIQISNTSSMNWDVMGNNMASASAHGAYFLARNDDHPSRPSHEENIYRSELARGGTQICLIDPHAGDIIELTGSEEGTWDLRPTDGTTLAFVRARLRQAPEIWTVEADGTNERFVTGGAAGKGADFPAWV